MPRQQIHASGKSDQRCPSGRYFTRGIPPRARRQTLMECGGRRRRLRHFLQRVRCSSAGTEIRRLLWGSAGSHAQSAGPTEHRPRGCPRSDKLRCGKLRIAIKPRYHIEDSREQSSSPTRGDDVVQSSPASRRVQVNWIDYARLKSHAVIHLQSHSRADLAQTLAQLPYVPRCVSRERL